MEGVSGGSKVASEQMQPVYEVKTIVQQNAQRLAGLEQRVKVALTLFLSPSLHLVTCGSLTAGFSWSSMSPCDL